MRDDRFMVWRGRTDPILRELDAYYFRENMMQITFALDPDYEMSNSNIGTTWGLERKVRFKTEVDAVSRLNYGFWGLDHSSHRHAFPMGQITLIVTVCGETGSGKYGNNHTDSLGFFHHGRIVQRKRRGKTTKEGVVSPHTCVSKISIIVLWQYSYPSTY